MWLIANFLYMDTPNENSASANQNDLKALLSDKTYLNIPKEGDVIKGKVIDIAKNEVRIDVPGYRTGIIRGRELSDPLMDHGGLEAA
jgi:ribosomal protein S1